MKKVKQVLTVFALSASLLGSVAYAQDHHDDKKPAEQHDKYVRHDEWKKGSKINKDDWARARPVDYHQYHLSAPPRGYEWRTVDGNYVLAAVATGAIASVIVASEVH